MLAVGVDADAADLQRGQAHGNVAIIALGTVSAVQ
jgi:hypothetical protein